MTTSTLELSNKSLSDIAHLIKQDWRNLSIYAKPYVEAMEQLNSIEDNYYADSAQSVVLYFLANAQSWRGDIAREVKAYLKKITK